MKLLRCLPLIAGVCMLSGIAKADPVDFHMVVVDPPPASYTVNDLTTSSATVSFSACAAGQLPTGITDTYVGCETFENLTGAPLTSLQLIFPDTGALTTQVANCSGDPTTALNFFTSATCSIVNGNFILDYSNGNIPIGSPNGIFTIAEDGVAPDCFPDGTLNTNITPEPSSIWLLSTGVLMLGFFFYKRRNAFGATGL